MTNEEMLAKSLNNFQYDILTSLADEALERGEEALSLGYLYLRDSKKWPYCYHEIGKFFYSFKLDEPLLNIPCNSFVIEHKYWNLYISRYNTPFEALKRAAELEGNWILEQKKIIDNYKELRELNLKPMKLTTSIKIPEELV